MEFANICALQTLGIAFRNFREDEHHIENSPISIPSSTPNSKNIHTPHANKTVRTVVCPTAKNPNKWCWINSPRATLISVTVSKLTENCSECGAIIWAGCVLKIILREEKEKLWRSIPRLRQCIVRTTEIVKGFKWAVLLLVKRKTLSEKQKTREKQCQIATLSVKN